MLCKQLVAIWLTIANLFHSKILQGGLFSSAKAFINWPKFKFWGKIFTNHQEHLEPINFTTTVVFTISHIATPYGMQAINSSWLHYCSSYLTYVNIKIKDILHILRSLILFNALSIHKHKDILGYLTRTQAACLVTHLISLTENSS